MYRFRTIDGLPEQPSPGAIRGVVVHKVLEDLFDLPAAERTPERAGEMVQAAWDFVLDAEPELAAMFAEDEDPDAGLQTAAWLASCRESLRGYFDLEDPRRLEPAEREVYVEALLDSRLLLRGFVDRIDVAPDGSIRVVDYKTGHSPGIGFESKALFQMRFYALVIWRTRGVVPTLLQLIYLGDGQVVSYRPDEEDLRATERLVEALWRAIKDARSSGEWLPSPGAFCQWCSFQEYCPAFGNQPPPLPEPVVPAGE
jgi:putative RecB family exonuclease